MPVSNVRVTDPAPVVTGADRVMVVPPTATTDVPAGTVPAEVAARIMPAVTVPGAHVVTTALLVVRVQLVRWTGEDVA
jgi:hypothetical protein